MKEKGYIRHSLSTLLDMSGHIDTMAASENIRENVYFKGPNVLILAFSIIIASVGLNINSTAVIIGAMLISPLMGPIIGLGLSAGINDAHLFRDSIWNFAVMVVISLMASALYFLLSPLDLANPTELEARTSPSIFDVLIALFGGAAGILELSRKKKGTVISGVAIATALMPPLCTAGYGIATWNGHFFFGAMGLFTINAVFIALASYFGTKMLKFPEVTFMDEITAKRTRTIASILVVLVLVPSVWSAVTIIKQNNFEIGAQKFISENRTLDKAYIYDHKVNAHDKTVEIKVTGRQLSEDAKAALYNSAASHGIPAGGLVISENSLEEADMLTGSEKIVSLFEKSESELAIKEARIADLTEQLDSLKGARIPSTQITRELRSQYPNAVKDVLIAAGSSVSTDSLSSSPRTAVIVTMAQQLPTSDIERLESWFKARLNDENLDIIWRKGE